MSRSDCVLSASRKGQRFSFFLAHLELAGVAADPTLKEACELQRSPQRWECAPAASASDLSSVETTGIALPCSWDMSFLLYQGGTHVDVLHLQVRCAARAVQTRSCLLLARRRLRRSAPLTAGPLPPCSKRWQKTERREKGEVCNVCCTSLAVVLFVWLLECACAWQVYDPSVKCCVLSGVLRLQWQAGGAQKGGARPPSRACRSALRRATSDCTPGSITHVHARPPQNPSCSPGWCCSCASRTPNGCPWSWGAALTLHILLYTLL